jgi:hypothetical protein
MISIWNWKIAAVTVKGLFFGVQVAIISDMTAIKTPERIDHS